jgi:cyclic pyranopterin monophosphate synthase
MKNTPKLTHLDEQGNATMVDVGEKTDTVRIAIAKGDVKMNLSTLSLIKGGEIKKGDVLTVAKVAGISASKKTSDLIPFCHSLLLQNVQIGFEFSNELPGILITASVKTIGKTGVEMEALTAVSVAALTIYDMAKAAEKTMVIQNIRLVKKTGGKSGEFNSE